jgi:hypothetical protein
MKDFLDNTNSSMTFNDFACMLDFKNKLTINNLSYGRVKLEKKKNLIIMVVDVMMC